VIKIYDKDAILVVYYVPRVSTLMEDANLAKAGITSLDGLVEPVCLLGCTLAKPDKGFSNTGIDMIRRIKTMKALKLGKRKVLITKPL
jgi:hypothetical protein